MNTKYLQLTLELKSNWIYKLTLKLLVLGAYLLIDQSITAQTPSEDKWSKDFYSSAGFDGDGVREIKIFGDDVYICGNWGGLNGDENYNCLMKWDGTSWEPIAKGIIENDDAASIWDMIITEDSIIACGNFENAGGDGAADQLAVYHFDTQKWSALIDVDNNGAGDLTFENMVGGETVYTLLQHGDDLYIGGNFTDAGGIENTNGVAKWNTKTNTWSALNDAMCPTGSVQDMVAIGDSLYISGRYWKIGETEYKGLASYSPDDNSWHRIGTTTHWNFSINDLETRGGNLYLGGEFPDINGDTDIKYFAAYDPKTGIFSPVGPVDEIESGDGGVYNIFLSDDAIYAVGWVTFGSSGNKHYGFGKLKDGSWQTVTPLFDGLDNNFYGSAMAVKEDGTILTCSSFDNADGEENFRYFGEYKDGEWSAMYDNNGIGFDANINCISIKNNVPFIGGDFTNAFGDPNADYFLYWNGVSYESIIGEPLNGRVTDIVHADDKLYIAGDFTDAGGDPNADHLAVWGGLEWESVGGISFENATIYDLDTFGTSLYIAGDFTDAAGIENADYMAKWDGTNWSEVSYVTVNGTIKAIDVVAEDEVYIGGDFTDAGGNGHNDCLALWDGTTFQNLNTFYWGATGVNDLQVKGDTIVITGKFQNLNAGDNLIDYIAMYNGTEWVGAGDEHCYRNGESVLIDGDDIFFSAGDLYLWNADGVSQLGGGLADDCNTPVYTMAKNKSNLWVGGSFTSNNNGVPMGHISYYNLADIEVTGSPTAFSGTYGFDSYTSQSCTFTASRLGEDVTVYAPNGFLVSSDDLTYESSFTVTAETAEAGSTTAYFKPSITIDAGSHFENLQIYSDSAIATITLEATVSKAELTVTADDLQMSEGDDVPELTMSFDGFANSDNQSDIDFLPSISTTATSFSNYGYYPITLAGGSDNNYDLILEDGTMEVLLATNMSNEVIKGISIYPNPFKDYLKVEAPEQLKVKIFDVTGKFCISAYTNEFIEFKGFEDGVYFIKIENINKVYKVIKR